MLWIDDAHRVVNWVDDSCYVRLLCVYNSHRVVHWVDDLYYVKLWSELTNNIMLSYELTIYIVWYSILAIHSVVYSARLLIVLFFIKAVVDFALPRRTNCLPAKCFITEISIRYLNNRTNRGFFCFVEHYYVFACSLKFKGFPWLLLVILVFCLLFINNDSVVFFVELLYIRYISGPFVFF